MPRNWQQDFWSYWIDFPLYACTSTHRLVSKTEVNCVYDCIDIDECAENSGNCHSNASCTGGFECKCIGGFMGNGTSCAGMFNESKITSLSYHHPGQILEREMLRKDVENIY